MRKYQTSLLYFAAMWLLSAMLCAAVPSARPGVGAIPYPGGTTFRVWAPNASTVTVAGTFNGWSSMINPLANEGGGWWSVDAAGANVHDQYKYVINGTLWKVDPRAGDVVNSTDNGIIVDNSYNWTRLRRRWMDDDTLKLIRDSTYIDPDPANNEDLHWMVRGFVPKP
jgi:hypothetical protein